MASIALTAGGLTSGKKSRKQRKKEALAREGGHYSKKGRPGPSSKYTGIKPAGTTDAAPRPAPTPGSGPAKSLGGARTPLSA